jgi:hypothetical protein
VPDALAKRATAIAADQTVPLGTTESYPLPGVTTLIRIEPRIWSRNEQGVLVQGCFRSGSIYLPAAAAAGAGTAPSETGLAKAAAVLTVVSLAVGTAATLAAWGEK